ncbi:MAG: thioredoxin domain-containing protein [Candidatus Omnitrophica bacterium]|nr:thioredoxin domain-containing protein [Candidatus Omnitrophota bacterium]
MENNNKLLTVVLVALTAVVGGLGVVFSVGMAIQSATMPMTSVLKEIADGQKKMEASIIQSGKSELKALEVRLAALETEVTMLKSRPQLAERAQQPQPPQPPAEDLNKVYDLPVGSSHILGAKNAKVTITIFEDYQCPFCGKFYPAALEAQKAFPGNVRVIVKHFPLPFHNMARPAAKAAIAAGEQGKFFEMSDLIFANAAALSDDKFKELAGKAGLNVDKFLKDLKDKDADYEKAIQADMELGARSDVRGTPTYFLNGKKSNARSAEEWKAQIGELLK